MMRCAGENDRMTEPSDLVTLQRGDFDTWIEVVVTGLCRREKKMVLGYIPAGTR